MKKLFDLSKFSQSYKDPTERSNLPELLKWKEEKAKLPNLIPLEFYYSPKHSSLANLTPLKKIRMSLTKKETCYAIVHFSKDCEGSIGFVHGGAIFNFMDVISGYKLFNKISRGLFPITMSMKIESICQIPLDSVILFESKVTSNTNKICTVEGKLFKGDTIFTKSTSLFYKKIIYESTQLSNAIPNPNPISLYDNVSEFCGPSKECLEWYKEMKKKPELEECFPSNLNTKDSAKLQGKSYFNERMFTFCFIHKETKKLYSIVHFGFNVEGPPNLVHGGCLATFINEMFFISSNYIKPGLNLFHSLELEYKISVPLDSTFYSESEFEKIDSTNILTFKGRIFKEDKTYIKANGQFVHVVEALKNEGQYSNRETKSYSFNSKL